MCVEVMCLCVAPGASSAKECVDAVRTRSDGNQISSKISGWRGLLLTHNVCFLFVFPACT